MVKVNKLDTYAYVWTLRIKFECLFDSNEDIVLYFQQQPRDLPRAKQPVT